MTLPICLLLAAAASPTPPAPTPAGGSGENAKPLSSLTISVDQNVFKAGSKIWLHIAETNISGSRILWQGGGAVDYEIYVFDHRGALAPQTDWGAFVLTGKQPPGKILRRFISIHSEDWNAGESKESGALINDLYNLSPGKYTVRVERLGSGLKSNTITITVTP